MKSSSFTQWLGRLASDRCRSVPLLLLLVTLPLQAAEEVDPTVKLREQLRSVMLQLRTSQTDAANAQAAQSIADQKSKELAEKITTLEKRHDALVKQSAADKTASEETIAKLNNKVAEREKRLADLAANREEWKAGYQKAAGVANTKEDERAKLAAEVLVNKRTIADLQAKNISLFNTATEILDRYESYALGKALGAREPFIGTTRVKIENQVQGYKDKILDQRIQAPAAKP